MHFLRIIGFVLALMCLACCSSAEPEEAVELTCLNIGKADCLILRAGGKSFLIDTGYFQTWPAAMAAMEELGVEKLDGVFLTHCHKDHMGGLMPLAQSGIPVEHWYASTLYYNINGDVHPIIQAASVRDAEPEFLKTGDIIEAAPGMRFDILGPVYIDEDNENNNSLVMRFASPFGSILFTGDMKLEEEESLLSRGLIPKTDVLKAAHHGDSKATGEGLLQAARPAVTLISTNTGEEADTPAGSTLRRLAASGSDVYITQDASDAWQVRLGAKGITVTNISFSGIPARYTGITMNMDIKDDVLTIFNTGSGEIDLSGAVLWSSRGDDLFDLGNLILQPGVPFRIGSKSSGSVCDMVLDAKKVWHKSKLDTAVLYDAWGRPVSRCNNGFDED